MWRIVGVDKITKKTVDIATADNIAEKRIIMRQEYKNYDCLNAVRINMSAWGSWVRIHTVN